MISYSELAFQLFLAAFLGGLVGLERERKSWFAGLRTHMLVCIGATLIMIVSQYGFEKVIHKELIILDPSRVAAQVVSGIGFLGAGTILFWKNKIKGLTTAASLWAVAAVGLAIGGDLYVAAIIATILIVVTLALLKPIERLLFKSSTIKEINFSIRKGFSLSSLDKILKDAGSSILFFELKIDKAEDKELVHLNIESSSETNLLNLVSEIRKLADVENVEILE